MQPDSEEINLSTVELQVLSELDRLVLRQQQQQQKIIKPHTNGKIYQREFRQQICEFNQQVANFLN